MKKWIQDAYNEWLLNYGYRSVTGVQLSADNNTLYCRTHSAIMQRYTTAEIDCNNHDRYTLQKLTKE